MLVTLLGQILQQAVDYELIDRKPARVGGRSARFLKRVRPDRTFLEVDEFHALRDAAAELEAEGLANRKGLGRRAMTRPRPVPRPILARAVTRANANRSESGLAPLPAFTPHSLREKPHH